MLVGHVERSELPLPGFAGPVSHMLSVRGLVEMLSPPYTCSAPPHACERGVGWGVLSLLFCSFLCFLLITIVAALAYAAVMVRAPLTIQFVARSLCWQGNRRAHKPPRALARLQSFSSHALNTLHRVTGLSVQWKPGLCSGRRCAAPHSILYDTLGVIIHAWVVLSLLDQATNSNASHSRSAPSHIMTPTHDRGIFVHRNQ